MNTAESVSYTNAIRASREAVNSGHMRTRWGRRKETWGMYNSSIESYQATFGPLVLRRPLAALLEEHDEPVVADMMSSSEALAGLFKQLPQIRKRGVTVTLTDNRNFYRKWRDRRLGIEQIAGDLTNPKTWKQTVETVGEEQAHLIMERAVWGVKFLPHHADFYAYAMSKLWTMLSPNNGHLLMEVPSERYMLNAGVNIIDWITKIKNTNTIYLQNFGLGGNGLLKMVKTPDSPKELPRPLLLH